MKITHLSVLLASLLGALAAAACTAPSTDGYSAPRHMGHANTSVSDCPDGGCEAPARPGCGDAGADAAEDGCACLEGERRECGSDVGSCRPGTQVCQQGQWGACEGSVEPMPADGCEEGNDDSCNGTPNEGCQCLDGDRQPCGTTVGSCRQGTQQCANGQWGVCEGGIAPRAADTCEPGNDDDCDGAPNGGCECQAGATRVCGTDVGSCRKGVQRCGIDGLWGACEGAVSPQVRDSCGLPGNDDDCDGIANGDCECVGQETEACGQCGLRSCNARFGVWRACTGSEETRAACGDCGSRSCLPDGTWAGCVGEPEVTRACGSCGINVCAADGTWGACTGRQVTGSCGECGTRACEADGQWGRCAGDTNLAEACGDCGQRVCGADGAWGACTGADLVEACGSCGERACGADGTWGECTGDENRVEVCESCGHRVCSADGEWSSCAPLFVSGVGEDLNENGVSDCAENLLVNGAFNDSVDGWDNHNGRGAPWWIENEGGAAPVREGVALSAIETNGGSISGGLIQCVEARGGAVYDLWADALTLDDASEARIFVWYYSEAGCHTWAGSAWGALDANVTGQWVRHQLRLNVPDNVKSMKVGLESRPVASPGQSTVYYDAALMVEP